MKDVLVIFCNYLFAAAYCFAINFFTKHFSITNKIIAFSFSLTRSLSSVPLCGVWSRSRAVTSRLCQLFGTTTTGNWRAIENVTIIFFIFKFVIAYSDSWFDPFNTVIGTVHPDLSLSALAKFRKEKDDSEAKTNELWWSETVWKLHCNIRGWTCKDVCEESSERAKGTVEDGTAMEYRYLRNFAQQICLWRP